ncbi:MAG TPA: helix-turn-helix domain-containing protein [Natrialbaceae archaeon]|nr:helix-turn-helix domain-containing protein [Natrialbaceae archaeon]
MIEECLAVEIRVTGDECPLAEASATTGVAIDAEPPRFRDDGYALLRFSAPADDRLVEVLDADDRIRYLHVSGGENRRTFRCLSLSPCVVRVLVNAGFLVETLRYRDGVGQFTGTVVGHEVLRGVMDTAGDTVGVQLGSVYPLGPEDGTAVAGRWNLTPRQEEALRTALAMGYFSVPKEATADEVAGELGIGASAFLERLRRGQASLLSQVL